MFIYLDRQIFNLAFKIDKLKTNIKIRLCVNPKNVSYTSPLCVITKKRMKYIRLESYEEKKEVFTTENIFQQILSQKNVREVNKENFIIGTITHTLKDTQLPISFDSIFVDKQQETFTHTNITIRGCWNYGLEFHTKLWQGYSHIAIIEFEQGIPDFFKILKPSENKKRWDFDFIICKKEDLKNCKKQIKDSIEYVEKFMKEKNHHIWLANKKEEEQFKSKNK